MIRRSHILTTAALLAVCVTPASAATYEDFHSSGPVAAEKPSRDLRSPDARDAAEHRGLYAVDRGQHGLGRSYGSPDAADAATPAADPQPGVLTRSYGSPDAADAARDLPPVQIPAPVVEVRELPTGGFDWADAGIGAAGMLALFSIAAGSALMLTGRRRRRGVQVATR